MAIRNILTKAMVLALATTGHALSTTRYTKAIPAGAVVVGTREDLNAAAKANPSTILDDVDNGFHLIDGKGKVVVVASDELIPELEDAFREIDAANANTRQTKRDDAMALGPLACSHHLHAINASEDDEDHATRIWETVMAYGYDKSSSVVGIWHFGTTYAH